jgi:hypothetical protein
MRVWASKRSTRVPPNTTVANNKFGVLPETVFRKLESVGCQSRVAYGSLTLTSPNDACLGMARVHRRLSTETDTNRFRGNHESAGSAKAFSKSTASLSSQSGHCAASWLYGHACATNWGHIQCRSSDRRCVRASVACSSGSHGQTIAARQAPYGRFALLRRQFAKRRCCRSR